MNITTLADKFNNIVNFDETHEHASEYITFIHWMVNYVNRVETGNTKIPMGITQFNENNLHFNVGEDESHNRIFFVESYHKLLKHIFVSVRDLFEDEDGVTRMTYSVGFTFLDGTVVYIARKYITKTEDYSKDAIGATRNVGFISRLLERLEDCDFTQLYLTLDKPVPKDFVHYPFDYLTIKDEDGVDDDENLAPYHEDLIREDFSEAMIEGDFTPAQHKVLSGMMGSIMGNMERLNAYYIEELAKVGREHELALVKINNVLSRIENVQMLQGQVMFQHQPQPQPQQYPHHRQQQHHAGQPFGPTNGFGQPNVPPGAYGQHQHFQQQQQPNPFPKFD